jgi:hypothetical protein
MQLSPSCGQMYFMAARFPLKSFPAWRYVASLRTPAFPLLNVTTLFVDTFVCCVGHLKIGGNVLRSSSDSMEVGGAGDGCVRARMGGKQGDK